MVIVLGVSLKQVPSYCGEYRVPAVSQVILKLGKINNRSCFMAVSYSKPCLSASGWTHYISNTCSTLKEFEKTQTSFADTTEYNDTVKHMMLLYMSSTASPLRTAVEEDWALTRHRGRGPITEGRAPPQRHMPSHVSQTNPNLSISRKMQISNEKKSYQVLLVKSKPSLKSRIPSQSQAEPFINVSKASLSAWPHWPLQVFITEGAQSLHLRLEKALQDKQGIPEILTFFLELLQYFFWNARTFPPKYNFFFPKYEKTQKMFLELLLLLLLEIMRLLSWKYLNI